jgi:hypothetical protein
VIDEPIAASLEERVPASTFSRHLAAKVNLGFVRQRRAARRARPPAGIE